MHATNKIASVSGKSSSSYNLSNDLERLTLPQMFCQSLRHSLGEDCTNVLTTSNLLEASKKQKRTNCSLLFLGITSSTMTDLPTQTLVLSTN